MKGASRVYSIVTRFPVLLVGWANGVFIWNHFYARGAFWYDSGWFSGIVWRAGLFGRNPASPYTVMPHFWGWHPSLLITAGSLLSYFFPGDRVDWYCVFQAAVFAPLAFAVPILVPKENRNGLRAALLVAAASIAFSFGGQVVYTMGFPHFEIFASAGISIMLAALAMGRERVVWIGIAIAIATREDGGFHAASLLGAVLLSDFLGRPFPIQRRRIFAMLGVGFGATLVLIVVQKNLFVTVDAWEIYLAGKPAYAHLTKDLLASRLARISERGGFLWWPFALTSFIAIVRRDARYLLGWLATLPWFVLNICALQEFKGEIAFYTGFPFVAGAFFAAAYARAGDRRPVAVGWPWPVLVAGTLGAISLLGLYAGDPWLTKLILADAFVPSAQNTRGVRAFAQELREKKHGLVRMDRSVTAWAFEAWTMGETLWEPVADNGLNRADGYAFFLDRDSTNAIVSVPFTNCGRVQRTTFFFCTRSERPLPRNLVPSSPLLALQHMQPGSARRDGETIVVDPGLPGIKIYGPYVHLPPGRYAARWSLELRGCSDTATIKVDVARLNIATVAEQDVTPLDRNPELAFEVSKETSADLWEWRTHGGACAIVLTDIVVRRHGAGTR